MAIKNSQRLSELEYCFSQYFSRNLAPVTASVKDDLQKRQLAELGEYQNSGRGFLNALSDASHMVPGIDTSYATLQVVGRWNSKTMDDYLDMVRKQIAGDKSIQKDMAVMASAWRKAVIDEVGRKAYDDASKQLGADLAYAYIGYRFEEQMLDKMVSDHMPRSSVEYVLRKAGDRSILGIANILKECPADREINSRIEARYKPSTFEQCAVRGTAFAMDVITLGGVSSWGSLAKMAGAEVVFSGLEAYTTEASAGKKQLSVEECISRGVFGSNTNVFTSLRKDAYIPRTWEHPNLIALNKRLSKKLPILETKPMFAEHNPIYNPQPFKPFYQPAVSKPAQSDNDIPLVVAPGMEEEYREDQRKAAQRRAVSMAKAEKNDNSVWVSASDDIETKIENDATDTIKPEVTSDIQQDTNLSGWEGLLKSFGLDGISATGHSLGYVIAMLPDVLFGALTGKSKNLGLEDNLIPIASVLAGFFVRNPLLKMTLIGWGGANLLDKAGKEAIGSQVQLVQTASEPRYKSYADEPLDPRIAGVSIQGGALVCTIDRVPCTISLPPATVAAYEAGALPLNTLANAVLSRHDTMQEELALTYQQQYEHARQQTQGAAIK